MWKLGSKCVVVVFSDDGIRSADQRNTSELSVAAHWLRVNNYFFCLQAARVRVPGRSPFSQLILHETDKSNVVRKTKTFIIKGQTNERINQTNPQTNESSEVEWVKDERTIPESSHRGCTRRGVIGFEILVTRARIRSWGKTHRWHVSRVNNKLAEMSGETWITRWSTACLKVGERKQLNQPRSWWNRVKQKRDGSCAGKTHPRRPWEDGRTRTKVRSKKADFFCWQLLGYVPDGSPFSQLNKGDRDAMAMITYD